MSLSTNVSSLDLEDWPYTDPPTIQSYDFEKFDAIGWRRWMYTNWPVSIHFSVLYLVFIVYGQRFMRNRQPFNLKPQLIIWNMSLALFSLCGFIRTFPELLQVIIGPHGLHRSVCVR
jgi:elongation of very long chain fatty acids protein 6